MNCSCPKCDADIQVDRSRATEAGSSTACPECKACFWLLQEPFMLRAFRKEGKLHCGKCGSPLGASTMCEACGELFPAYCVVQASKPARRRARKAGDSFRLSHKSVKLQRATSPESARTSRNPLPTLVVLVAVVVVLALAVGSFVLNMKAEQQYSRTYVLALYGVKSGADRSLNRFAKIAAEWKAKTDSGQVFLLRITPEEKSDLDTVKAEVDMVMQQLGVPPDKFVESNDRLSRLYQVYTKLYTLNLSPPVTLSGFTDSTARLESDFNRATEELQAGLPDELLEEIRRSAPRYKSLQVMTAK
jgi:hypothetical protein